MRYPAKIILCAAMGMTLSAIGAAMAAAPTEAQQQAIRSNCVKDYRAHCSSVPTGGMDALVCLEQNADSLSPACKSAVEAVEPPASTPAPAASAPAPAAGGKTADTTDEGSAKAPAASASAAPSDDSSMTAAPAAPAAPAAAPAMANQPKLTFRQEMAIAAGSCATDFRLFCPNLPVGRGNALFCLQVHAKRLAEPCRNALTKLGVDLQ